MLVKCHENMPFVLLKLFFSLQFKEPSISQGPNTIFTWNWNLPRSLFSETVKEPYFIALYVTSFMYIVIYPKEDK